MYSDGRLLEELSDTMVAMQVEEHQNWNDCQSGVGPN